MGLPNRTSINTPAPDRKNGPPAMNPNFILAVRFLLTALVCALALATAIMCILVVVYYNTHDPIIRPSWGSLIFLIVLGFFTGTIYIGYNIVLPLMPFIHYGDFLYSLFMVKIELLLQFAMCVLWVSGALAYANDLRGYENCQFDGYYHYPKPADFHHVCDLTNWAVPLAYATFGVQVLLWFIETVFGLYTFLYLDQESLNEPMFEWGRRAYNWRIGAETNGTSSSAAGNTSRNYRASANNGSTSPNGVGRRGYNNDEEAGHDGEMSEVHSQASLGNRGRRGATYGQDDEIDEDVHEESGWHLREDPSTRA